MNPADPTKPSSPTAAGSTSGASVSAPPPSAFSRFLSTIRRWTLWTMAIVVLAYVVYVFVALRFSYAEGERAGLVQKFSNQGFVCKTWEGELAVATVPGSLPEKFVFTVRDAAVAAAINASMGKQVSLRYELHPPVPSCFGETNYQVTGVREVR